MPAGINILNDAAPEFEDLFSRTIKNKRNVVSSYSSVSDLWNHEKSNESRAYCLLCHLPEEKPDVDELGHILENIFKKDRDAFQHMITDQRTNIRRLIRVYDFLKWRQFVIMKYQEA